MQKAGFVRWQGVVVAAVLGMLVMTGCATVYEVRSTPTQGQELSQSSTGQSAITSSKQHVVSLAFKPTFGQFEDVRLQVSFTNRADKPIYFASEMVGAELQGVPMQALSYESQVFDIQNRLAYYGLRISYLQPSQPLADGLMKVDVNDMLDVVRARADYAHLQRFGLKPGWVEPGQTVSGEVVLPQRLPQGRQIDLKVNVNVGGESHQFSLGYQS